MQNIGALISKHRCFEHAINTWKKRAALLGKPVLSVFLLDEVGGTGYPVDDLSVF